ncbi:MAG TPA: helix-turn-helix transcriptional regulator [Coriobacteriia bacterium]|nr:helix-turn-helix transcriptional regulator [Coriobacteriia bacterium]
MHDMRGIAVDKHATYKTLNPDGESFGPSDGGQRHRDSKTLDYLVTILGFGLCFAWIVFCLSEPISAESGPMFNWLYLGSGAAAALLSALLTGGSRSDYIKERIFVYRATAVLTLLSSILLPIALNIHNEILTLIGFIVGGAGAGFLQVLWGEQLTKHEVRFASFASPAASIVSGASVALSLPGVPEGINLFGYVAFPLVSVGLLFLKADRSDLSVKKVLGVYGKEGGAHATRENSTASTSATEAERRKLDTRVLKLMFSVMIFSLLCRMFDVLLYDYKDPFAFFGDSSLFALVVVGTLFLLLAALLKDRFNLALTYRLALPIMVAGFVGIALCAKSQVALSVLLINIGYNFFDILIWILLADIVIRRALQPLRVFGAGVAFMFVGMALGYFIGDIIDSHILQGDIQITVVAMMCVLSLVMVAFLVVPEGSVFGFLHGHRPLQSEADTRDVGVSAGEAGAGAEGTTQRAAGAESDDFGSRLDANCEAVAVAYGLTRREKEVLVLLAHGRTLNIITRDLTIATGTARSHMEKIYRKLGVHKQQELIDLVEGFDSK